VCSASSTRRISAKPNWPTLLPRSAAPASSWSTTRRDCAAAGELSRLIALGSDVGRALVLGGDAESIGLGFSGWQVEAKRARRGCLTAPSTLPDGDLIGVRLSRDVLGQPPRPGHCLLNTGDGRLISVSVPIAEIS
jgi:S-DNA-T family DNA segregation ATPase FtsK/SpoIIIE